MSQSDQISDPAAPRRLWGCGCITWLVIGFAVLLALPAIMGTGWGAAFFTVLFGWVAFLGRTGERIHWNFDLIGMGLLCSAIGLGMGHWLLAGLARAAGETRGKSWRWPWKWTLCGAGMLGLVFLIGMAVGGIVHQAGWIHSNPEPLMERKGRNWEVLSNMRNFAAAYQIGSDDATNDLWLIHQDIWAPTNGYWGTPQRTLDVMQAFHCLAIVDDNQKAQGYLIFPRDPALARKTGGYYSLGTDYQAAPWEKIQALLHDYRERLQPL